MLRRRSDGSGVDQQDSDRRLSTKSTHHRQHNRGPIPRLKGTLKLRMSKAGAA
jgi:hypothetical protein